VTSRPLLKEFQNGFMPFLNGKVKTAKLVQQVKHAFSFAEADQLASRLP